MKQSQPCVADAEEVPVSMDVDGAAAADLDAEHASKKSRTTQASAEAAAQDTPGTGPTSQPDPAGEAMDVDSQAAGGTTADGDASAAAQVRCLPD